MDSSNTGGDRVATREVVPAVVTAGDGRAAKAVYGESKVYLELGGRPLVAHTVIALQRVPEISEVWVVGDAPRLREVFDRAEIAGELHKPLHIVGQFRNLFENVWQTYRRLLPGAGADGRDPEPDDEQRSVLYLSGDLPFATPQEISQFVRRSSALDCDYALGLVTEESMAAFYPAAPGGPGIRMAYFNLQEGRFRMSNLHLVKPARVTNRTYIEDMYEHRHQKEFGNIVGMAWTILRKEEGGLRILWYYLLIHFAGVWDRRGWHGIADRLRSWIPLARMSQACGDLLRTDFQFAVTDVGGCAVDIDIEHDFDVAKQRFEAWSAQQRERAESLYGKLDAPVAASASVVTRPGTETPRAS
jgi:hypothetical protein